MEGRKMKEGEDRREEKKGNGIPRGKAKSNNQQGIT